MILFYYLNFSYKILTYLRRINFERFFTNFPVLIIGRILCMAEKMVEFANGMSYCATVMSSKVSDMVICACTDGYENENVYVIERTG